MAVIAAAILVPTVATGSAAATPTATYCPAT
jgi:hypothetical protein